LLSFFYLIVLQGVAAIGEMNNCHWGIKLTESVEQRWNGKLVFFMSSDAVLALHHEHFVPLCRWKNICFPTANTTVNSCRCLKDESCSLVYSPGKLLALFFVETWPDCKQLVVQNGLNVHDVSSTSFVDLDPNQVSSQLVQQLRMICMKISISSDNNAKDAMRVHKLDST
jgi:hypothetical protein